MTSEDSSSPARATRLWALIPCAGSGSRALSSLKGDGPPPLAKQYQPLAGKPLVLHTLAAFGAVRRLSGMLVVVAPGDDFFKSAGVDCRVAPVGGATRAHSVANGLKHLAELGAQPQDWVLVHDAARCLVTPQQIDTLIDACQGDEVGGLLAHKLPDTLKRELTGRVAGTLPRDDKWLAQTPQMFRLGPLSQALSLAGDQVTDEASAIEAMGLRPLLVPGSAQNFKVTYPADFEFAEVVLLGRRQRAENTSA